jgi:hypothetical protein
MCTLAVRGARDLSGADLGLEEATEELRVIGNEVTVASLFGRGINVPPRTEPAHLRVLSLVLASRTTARRVQNEYLSGIVDEAAEEHGDAAVAEALDSQLLPEREALDEDAEDRWAEFLEDRLERLAAFLENEVGQGIERSTEPH